MRDERAAPLFCYLVRHLDRKAFPAVYASAVEALGTFGGPDAVEALREALQQGHWLAPFRTGVRGPPRRAPWGRSAPRPRWRRCRTRRSTDRGAPAPRPGRN